MQTSTAFLGQALPCRPQRSAVPSLPRRQQGLKVRAEGTYGEKAQVSSTPHSCAQRRAGHRPAVGGLCLPDGCCLGCNGCSATGWLEGASALQARDSLARRAEAP